MKTIEAALPALGNYVVPFFNESEEVLNFLGTKELGRLDRVEHLGVASKVFAGVNHSRLEYTLLQCAIFHLLTKFHKGDEKFAIGNVVRIPDQRSKVSSGEELLKCWALLSNCGHAQYTFGVERSLLNHAREDTQFQSILIDDLPAKLKRWCINTIKNYDDASFHYVLALYKISLLPSRSRLKARLFRILGALLLPLDHQTTTDRTEHFKLFRLRRLFGQVRLLSMVTLDSYYSHHPIRFQVSTALLNLGALMDETEEKSEFIKLIEQTAGWLADELYLHPRAATAQKQYEVSSSEKLNGKFSRHISNKKDFLAFFPNFMETGFGQPKIDAFAHLARLSFPWRRFGATFGRDEYKLSKSTEIQLSDKRTTYVSVLTNPFSGAVHFDLVYDSNKADSTSIGRLYVNTFHWLSRLIEAQALWRIRDLRFPDSLTKEIVNRFRTKILFDLVNESYPALKSLFVGLVNYLLPQNLIGVMSEVMPQSKRQALAFRLQYPRGGEFDSITPSLNYLIDKDNEGCSADRLHELKALREIARKSKAPFTVVCLEKFIIRNKTENNKDVDDWDGVVLEVFDSEVRFSIVEAKNIKAGARENSAFKQLNQTRELLRRRHALSSNRKRIKGYGAVLTIRF